MTTRTVHRAATEHVSALTEILNDAVAYKLQQGDAAWGQTGWTEAGVLQTITRSEAYVIEHDGVCVATMSLSWQDEKYWGIQEPVAGYVHRIAVRNGFRGLSIGRFAMDWCANQVSARNRRFLRLDCDQRNTKLCAHYESLGFLRVGTRPIPELRNYVAALYEKAAR
ncbi:N-acetyltransferase [Paraburkholderia sp. BL21I4N1]|uniref:GNAT family N-acetyltransferase n=1 Tax=Paraburkholderia sp. BL21I4N1 TaxID=1938801 RepID=UPI000CFC0AFA|nr:GNAT family N-acetyltransferase [Paraburkholderia sp. BL21I4N1]PQV54688.1 acetyltransferase (GNAT) family protein [Paraburkholderia sp. BL21I4N1]